MTNQVEVDALVTKAIDVFGHVDIFVNQVSCVHQNHRLSSRIMGFNG